MFFLGITGGVGAGKSAILSHIKEHYNSRIMLADEIAHEVMEPLGSRRSAVGEDFTPDESCYGALRDLFGSEAVWMPDGRIDRAALAAVLFSDDEKRAALDGIVHPAVKEYVRRQYAREAAKGKLDVLVLEAALLIEEKYGEICDELWYIYTTEENRRKRLKGSRGYSDEKIDGIFAAQLSEEEFRAGCAQVIDNNAGLDATTRQVDALLYERGILQKTVVTKEHMG